MRKNFIKYLILIILLCLVGLTAIYFSGSIVSNNMYYFKRQLIYFFVGLCLFLFFKFVNLKLIYN